MIVEGVIVVIVSMSHLEEGSVDLHHLILQGPVGVPEVSAGVLNLHHLSLHGDSECCLARGNKQGA